MEVHQHASHDSFFARDSASLVFPPGSDAQLTTPGDWKWRQDAPAPLANGATMEPGSWVFVQMPPGWHVTTGPGVLLYPTANGDASGNFSLEADIFLFPATAARNTACSWAGRRSTGGAPDYVGVVCAGMAMRRSCGERGTRRPRCADWQRHDGDRRHVATGTGRTRSKNVPARRRRSRQTPR